MVYSGVERQERAEEGIDLLVHYKYNTWKIKKKINIISVHAPENNKPKQEREQFYDQLQETIESQSADEVALILGDFNAHIGSGIIPEIKQRFNKDMINANGELLINSCAFSELRINKTFFHHKAQHKYTRWQRSSIYHILSNRNIHPAQIRDIITSNSANNIGY